MERRKRRSIFYEIFIRVSNLRTRHVTIDRQEEHHRVKTFGEEYQGVIEDYGLKYSEDE